MNNIIITCPCCGQLLEIYSDCLGNRAYPVTLTQALELQQAQISQQMNNIMSQMQSQQIMRNLHDSVSGSKSQN